MLYCSLVPRPSPHVDFFNFFFVCGEGLGTRLVVLGTGRNWSVPGSYNSTSL